MEDEKIEHEDVWSAIRYLDSDEKEQANEATATIIAILAILLICSGVWIFLWLRVREP